jgi:hypothetical protein
MLAPRGYTDAHKIGDYLGRTLTAQQFAQATQLVSAVESYIDRRTGHSWLQPSPATNELHTVNGRNAYLYLNQHPVTAITSVQVRYSPLDTSPTTLPATDYGLVDPARGLLYLPLAYWGWQVLVTYTHTGPALPADLALAATMLGAHWLQSHIDGASGVGPGIKSYSVGQELSVTYADSSETGAAAQYGIPDNAKRIIDGYRARSKVFA